MNTRNCHPLALSGLKQQQTDIQPTPEAPHFLRCSAWRPTCVACGRRCLYEVHVPGCDSPARLKERRQYPSIVFHWGAAWQTATDRQADVAKRQINRWRDQGNGLRKSGTKKRKTSHSTSEDRSKAAVWVTPESTNTKTLNELWCNSGTFSLWRASPRHTRNKLQKSVFVVLLWF